MEKGRRSKMTCFLPKNGSPISRKESEPEREEHAREGERASTGRKGNAEF